MRLGLARIADFLGLPPPALDPVITGAAIDSRKAKPGDLFVCLPGERADGHDFALQAVQNGAAAVLAARALPDVRAPVLIAPNPELALGRIAAFWRSLFGGRVAVITGTCGKTTCKQALAAILAQTGEVASTCGNLNNQLGLPLTILAASGLERFWVLEAGISQPGDMEYLGEIARPDLALILNAGPGHEQGLAGRGVAWHKAQLLRYLAPGGSAIINGDCQPLVEAARALRSRLVFFGDCAGCAGSASQGAAPGAYSLTLAGRKVSVKTPMAGKTGADNALAAALAAVELGLSDRQIRDGLAAMRLAPRRGESCEVGRFHLIDASYNANPLSMAAMLTEARQTADRLRRPLVCVLGEMLELGASAQAEHVSLGRKLAASQPTAIFWKGGWSDEIDAGLRAAGGAASLQPAGEPAAIAAAICADPLFREQGAVILFQGSRANRLEEYVDVLKNRLVAGETADVL
ncbi:MAG: UDP-N-acetylmuramoyl-tripeptide--D-alanyl-D-alanine ligase [Desulfovibrio sp.]|nr:UDP-N-acetylmuramoyl-tripeptide--D-alanyl-D-alanine ligase [Desulfovibrio sp.]